MRVFAVQATSAANDRRVPATMGLMGGSGKRVLEWFRAAAPGFEHEASSSRLALHDAGIELGRPWRGEGAAV